MYARNLYAEQPFPLGNIGELGNQFIETDILELDDAGFEGDGRILEDWHNVIPGFGCYGRDLGTVEANWLVEVDEDDNLGDGTVLTPMLEFGIDDFNYIKSTGHPIPGMQAIGSNGDLYEYTVESLDNQLNGLGGLRSFFKKVKKKVKKVATAPHKIQKKVRKKIRSKAKKLMSKTKFGRAVIKVGGKVHNVWKKKVKPWVKKYGPVMKKLAPLAMAIPGVGPVVSKAMTMTGHLAQGLKVADGAMKIQKFVDKNDGSITNMVRAGVKNPQAFVSAVRQGADMVQSMMPAQRANLAKKFDMLVKAKSGKLNQLIPVQAASQASTAAAKKLSILAQKDNALAYAQNMANPLTQRKRALSHARKLWGQNMMMNADTRLKESKGKPNRKMAKKIKAMKIAALKMQLRGLGVNV